MGRPGQAVSVSWLAAVVVAGGAGLASMRAAVVRGDLDEASRQGVLAGPAVVEAALATSDRLTQLAGIAAAPRVVDAIELLPPLARLAAGPDRRLAVPAARAARTIARTHAHDQQAGELASADDVADDDLAGWRATWGTLAADPARPIEVRVLALDTAVALAADATLAIEPALQDRDPALRRTAIADVPVPVPASLRSPLARLITSEPEPGAALAAAAVLCADLATDPAPPVLEALGAPGLVRLRALITASGTSAPSPATYVLQGAARCLAADPDPASAAALRAIRIRLR